MRILVHAEHEAGAVRDTAFELIAIARLLGGEIEALVMGSEPEALAGQLGGADRVIAIADPALETYLPDAHAAALQAAIRERRPDLVLLSYGTAGLDIAPPVAHACGLPLICNAVALRFEETALAVRAQIYGGKLEASARVPLPAIAMAMPGAARAEEGRLDGTPPVETVAMPPGAAAGIRLVEALEPEVGGVDLTQAERIVCVGRAIGGTDKIAVVEELAGLLNAEIAGSRPVIDAGWLSKDRQVGKSGTTVKPRLYFMAGVSGAPEHLEGMSDSELIVAINTDERAPIFAKAHYGAVCDMFDVLPKLAACLKDS
ncbi:MAG: electron transfer flavoprotein subunit alpha/FixB family protein [Rhodospirillaceae bacterium]|nr:electron transfer flavoprotein subunit alpha/FixB family protein [Rhodospirillaceae bacterium]